MKRKERERKRKAKEARKKNWKLIRKTTVQILAYAHA